MTNDIKTKEKIFIVKPHDYQGNETDFAHDEFERFKKTEITPELEEKISQKARLKARQDSGVINKPFDPVRWLECQELTTKEVFKELRK